MASTPNFPSSPRATYVNISTANTARTASGVTNLTSLFVAGSSGSKIDQIVVKATGTTTAGAIRVWVYSGSGNAALMDEIPVSASSPSASAAAINITKTYNNFVIPTSHTVYVTTHNAESFNVFAFGGDF